MKALKILAVVAGVALGLVAILVAALWLLFDPQAIRTQAEEWVSRHTGRQLQIAGDLRLALYPRLGVAMGRVSLSERDQPGTRFAAIDEVRVGVPVVPLLSGRLEVEEVFVTGLDVRIVRFPDGTMNIDDLAGGAAAGTQAPPGEMAPGNAPALPAGFRLAGIRVENARLTYRDEQTARETVLDSLRLNLGPLADGAAGRLEFAAELREGQQRLHAALSSGYRLQFAPPQIALDGLDIRVRGHWAGVPELDAHWTSATLAADAEALVLGASQLRAAVRLPAAAAELALTLPDMRLGLPAGTRTLAIAAYTGDLKLTQATLPGGRLSVGLTGRVDADLDALSAHGENRLRVDETTLQASWRIPKFSPLAVTFDAGIDRLNVDRYLPQAAPAQPPATPATSAAPAGADPQIRLPLPAGIDVSGKLRAGELQVAGVKLTTLDLGMRVADRRLSVAPLRFDLYGGRATGRLSADAGGGQRFAVQLALEEVNLQPLLIDAAKTDLLAGRGRVGLDVTAGGQSLSALKAGLAGTASLALRDGAIKGINLARSLRELKSGLASGVAAPSSDAPESAGKDAQTDFSDLTASFRIARGVARNDDLLARSPFLRLTGAGDVDLPNGSLDYLAKVTVVNTATGQDGKSLDHLRGLTIPLRIRGPFAAPKFRLEVAGLAKEAAKEAAKDAARAKLGDKLGLPAGTETEAVREEAKTRLKEKVDERLKGLFGR